jgi:hypothetical protein
MLRLTLSCCNCRGCGPARHPSQPDGIKLKHHPIFIRSHRIKFRSPRRPLCLSVNLFWPSFLYIPPSSDLAQPLSTRRKLSSTRAMPNNRRLTKKTIKGKDSVHPGSRKGGPASRGLPCPPGHSGREEAVAQLLTPRQLVS